MIATIHFCRRVIQPILLTVFAGTTLWAQQSPPSDNTNTPLMRELRGKHPHSEGGGERDDPRARLEWERTARGEMTRPASQKHFDEFRHQQSEDVNDRNQPTWVNIGPSRADDEQNYYDIGAVMDSGRARNILPHPTDPNTVYFLSSGGGLWRTRNFRSSPPNWTPLTDNLPTTSGGAAAFGRTPNVLYLGLGDPFDITLPGGVMVKSMNGGDGWSQPVHLGNSLTVRDVKVDTGGSADVVLVATDTGIWRSADGGGSYVQVAGGSGQTMEGQTAWSLVRTSGGWLASAEACLACGQGSLYISVDHGATWSPITNGGGVFANFGRTTLAVGVPGDNIVYAFAANADDTDQGDLLRSADGGQTWQALNINSIVPSNPNADQSDMDLMHDQAWYNHMILVDPVDRETVYLGGNLSSAKSTDGGQSWTVLSNWLPPRFSLSGKGNYPYVHADFHAAALSQIGGHRTLFFGSDGGLFVSSDDGNSWTSAKNENLITHLFYTIGGNPNFPGVSFGGTQDNGTRVQKDGTTTYNQLIGGDGLGAGWSQATADTFIGSIQYGVIANNNTDRPPNSYWNFELNAFNDIGFYTPISFPSAVADPTGRVFFTAGDFNLYRSSDGGETYSLVGSISRGIRNTPFNIGVSPLSLKHLAVGSPLGHLEISMDGGANWNDYDLTAPVAGFVGAIYGVDWADDKTIYVASAFADVGVVRVVKGSFDGTNWTFTRTDAGLPDVSVQRVVADPSDPKTLYAATDIGVYQSPDAGAHWRHYGMGLPSVRVSDIYIPPNGRYVRVATYGRGIWELPGVNLKSAIVLDDGRGSNHNGILDSGELGHLAVTLHNDGTSNIGRLSATLQSSNPNVTFPGGNSINFPDAPSGGDTTGIVTIALASKVSGVQKVEFTITLDPQALATAAPVKFPAWATMNYKESTGQMDDVEAVHTAWTGTGVAPLAPDIFNWSRRENGPFQHAWAIGDSSANTDQALVSPALKVGNKPLVVSFVHRHSFEWDFSSNFYDGGVVEISTDNGITWSDIGASAYGGTIAATGAGNPLEGRHAFVAQNLGYPARDPVTLNLGTAYAHQTVRIRFRVGTDSYGGDPGWEVDNISVSGITNNPFVTLVPSH